LDGPIKQTSIHATRKQREVSELPQIGGLEVSITNDSIGTPGSCSFLQRQVEQGHSSRWVMLLSASTSASASGLEVAVGTNTEGSKRISSALLEFLQSNCRLEDPHLAEASEQKPKTSAATTRRLTKPAIVFAPLNRKTTPAPPEEGFLVVRDVFLMESTEEGFLLKSYWERLATKFAHGLVPRR
jgi:hypothetical protein